VWNVEEGVAVGDAVGAELHVRGLAVDAGSGDLMAVGDDRCLRRWETSRQVLEPVLRGHRAWVYSVAFLPDGSLVSGAGEAPEIDGRLMAWDIPSRQPVWAHKLGAAQDPNIIWRVAHDPLGTAVAVSGRSLHFVSESGVVERKLARMPYDLAVVDGGRLLAALEWESPDLVLYDREGRVHANIARPSVSMGGLAADASGRLLALAHESSLRRFRVSEGAVDELSPIALRGRGRSVSFSGNASLLAVGVEGGTVQVFDLAAPGAPREVWHARANPGEVVRVALSPDGMRLATGGTGPSIRVWDAQSGDMLLALDGHGDTVMDLRFSPDGTALASSSIDGTVRLWMADTHAGEKP
jgi:WD40 repeat protein